MVSSCKEICGECRSAKLSARFKALQAEHAEKQAQVDMSAADRAEAQAHASAAKEQVLSPSQVVLQCVRIHASPAQKAMFQSVMFRCFSLSSLNSTV